MRGARRRIGALARTATLILVLLVMAGSAAAFAISEGLKVQKARDHGRPDPAAYLLAGLRLPDRPRLASPSG